MDKLETLRIVIDRWEAFCFDYRSITRNGITYPAVLDTINWPHTDADYIRNKWAEVCDRYGCEGSAALHLFFCELDSSNQKALLEHVFGNRI